MNLSDEEELLHITKAINFTEKHLEYLKERKRLLEFTLEQKKQTEKVEETQKTDSEESDEKFYSIVSQDFTIQNLSDSKPEILLKQNETDYKLEVGYDKVKVLFSQKYSKLFENKFHLDQNLNYAYKKGELQISQLISSFEYKFNAIFSSYNYKRFQYETTVIIPITFTTKTYPLLIFEKPEFEYSKGKINVKLNWKCSDPLSYKLIRKDLNNGYSVVLLETTEQNFLDLLDIETAFKRGYLYILQTSIESFYQTQELIIPEDLKIRLILFPKDMETGKDYYFEILAENQFGLRYSNIQSLLNMIKVPNFDLFIKDQKLFFKGNFKKSGKENIQIYQSKEMIFDQTFQVFAKTPDFSRFNFPIIPSVLLCGTSLELEINPKDSFGNSLDIPLDIQIASQTSYISCGMDKIETNQIFKNKMNVKALDIGEFYIILYLNSKVIKEYRGSIINGPIDIEKTRIIYNQEDLIVYKSIELKLMFFDVNGYQIKDSKGGVSIKLLSDYRLLNGYWKNGCLFASTSFKVSGNETIQIEVQDKKKQFTISVSHGPLSISHSTFNAVSKKKDLIIKVTPMDEYQNIYTKNYMIKLSYNQDGSKIKEEVVEAQGKFEKKVSDLSSGFYQIDCELNSQKFKNSSSVLIEYDVDAIDYTEPLTKSFQNIDPKSSFKNLLVSQREEIHLLGQIPKSDFGELLKDQCSPLNFSFTSLQTNSHETCFYFYRRASAPLWDEWKENLDNLTKSKYNYLTI